MKVVYTIIIVHLNIYDKKQLINDMKHLTFPIVDMN